MKYLYTILSLFVSLQLVAQTVSVSDTNFAQALCNKVPIAMDQTCRLLDTVIAQNFDSTIDISNGNISDVSEIIYFNRPDTIIASNNNLTSFLTEIRADNFWSLDYLDLSNNQIKTFPRLSINVNFPLVRHVYFQNNEATEFQKLWGARDSLIALDISGNFIEDIQDLSMALKAKEINLSNNYLTFEDLLPHTTHPQFSTVFTVSPQRLIRWANESEAVVERTSFTLTLPVDSFVTTSTYTWYKDGNEIATTFNNSLTLDTLQLDDAGTYIVEITNSNAALANVTLTSEPLQLTVTPCVTLGDVPFIVDEKCNGAMVTTLLDSGFSADDTTSYMLQKEGKAAVYVRVDTVLELEIGRYTVSALKADGCMKTYEDKMVVNGFVGCDEYVITPNGDGLQDEYYFEQEGEAIIYNQFGQELRKILLPGFWDAKTISGDIVAPGKYIMIIDGNEQVELKIMW